MNLHNIVGNAISVLSPWIRASIQVSTGSSTDAAGKQAPAYRPPRDIQVKVQSLTADDLKQLDGLNIQGEKRALYLTGNLEGVLRPDHKGGDLVTLPDGTLWLVNLVLEDWHMTSGWVKVAVTRQRK